MQLALDDRLLGGPDWHSRQTRGAIVAAVALLHVLLFALLIATRPEWRQDAAEPEISVSLVRAPVEQDVDGAPTAEAPAGEPDQPAALPSIPLAGPAKPTGLPRRAARSTGEQASPPQQGAPSHCQSGPATLDDPLALPPCDQKPLDQAGQKALRELVDPQDRAALAREAEKATSNAAHIELFTILNDRFRPTPPSEDRSLQSRSEAALGMPGKDISVFAPEPSVFDKNPH